MPEYGFKTCRLLLANVWQRELTLIQRRILGALRGKRRAAEREVSRRENQLPYIRLQTTRRLSLFYGNIRMDAMRKARGNSSYIPFLLHLETRLDVLLVRIHFCQTLPQARQLISHGKICVNHGVANKIHWKVSPGSLISFKEDEERSKRNEVQLSVKTQSGKTILLDAKSSDFVGSLKAKIQDKEGIPVKQQAIVCDGIQLDDGDTVGAYYNASKPVFHLVLC